MKLTPSHCLTTYKNFNITYKKNILIAVLSVFYNYKEICKNYFLNLKKLKLHKNVIFCTNDIKLKEYFEGENIPFCFFNLKTPEFKTRLQWLEVERYLKTYMLLQLMKKFKSNIISSDADIFIHKNPLPYLANLMKKESFNLIAISDKRYKNNIHFKLHKNIIPTDQEKYGSLNGAFCFWKNRNLLKKTLKNTLSKINNYPKFIEEGAAKTIFNEKILK